MKPNFLFLGPDKAGSSWLYANFLAHPDIFVASAKDLYFFDRYYHLGWPWYEAQFAGAVGQSAIGEISHDYLFSALAAERISRELPGVKLLVSLREPVDRTFSHYLYLRRSGLTTLDFDTAVRQIPELLNKSRYAKHLRMYLTLFDPHQLHVAWFDQLRCDPLAYLNGILDFLGVSPVASLPVEKPLRAAAAARNVLASRVAKTGANLARSMGFARTVGVLKNHSLIVQMLYREYHADDKPVMTAEARKRVADALDSDVRALERLLGISLPNWPDAGGKAI